MRKVFRFLLPAVVILGSSMSHAQVDWSEMFPEEGKKLGETPTAGKPEATPSTAPIASPSPTEDSPEALVIPVVPTPYAVAPTTAGVVPPHDPFVGRSMPVWKSRPDSAKPPKVVAPRKLRRDGASWDKIEQPW
jgi:hypothetical protein